MSVNQKVYAAIVLMAGTVKEGEIVRAKSKELTQGAYNQAITAASIAKNGEEFAAAMDLVCDNVQFGRDNLHVQFGAGERKREDKKGRKYILPQSLMNARSLCKTAFERSVPFVIDGKVRSYTDVQKETRTKGEAIQAEEAKKLTGRPRLEWDTRALLAKLADALPKLAEPALKGLHASLSAVVMPAVAASAVADTREAAPPAPPAPEAATVASKPARARRGRNTVADQIAA